MKINNVYQADCRDLCRGLRNKVDLVYADILYGEFDGVPLSYICTTLKAGGALFLQTDYRSVAQAKIALDGLLEFVNWIVWPYDWGGRAKNAFGRKHDDILYYVDPKQSHVFNAKAVEIPKTVIMRSQKANKIPTDVWSDIGNFYTTSTERILDSQGHCTKWQKPEKLLERIILAASNKGDLIFEPYLGTGTACAVAKRLHRNYIGCDINRKMVEVAKRRLRAVSRPIGENHAGQKTTG